MTHLSGLTEAEYEAELNRCKWESATGRSFYPDMPAAMYIHASLRGRFPQLKDVWRRWAARMFGAAICGAHTFRLEEDAK